MALEIWRWGWEKLGPVLRCGFLWLGLVRVSLTGRGKGHACGARAPVPGAALARPVLVAAPSPGEEGGRRPRPCRLDAAL